MLSRSVAVLLSAWFPCLALILPLSRFHTIDALVAGVAATLLVAFSLVNERARLGAAAVSAWVAFTPFIFPSSFLETVLCVSWGTTMVLCVLGPVSHVPHSTLVRELQRSQAERTDHDAASAAA